MRFFVGAAIALVFATPALADSINVGFTPTKGKDIVAIQVNGKTTACTVVTSVDARGPKGCNFSVGIGANGKAQVTKRDSNAGCSMSCK